MELPVKEVAIVVGFMVLANRLVALLVVPLFERFKWDRFPIMYIAWVISGVFVGLAGVNLFADYMPDEIVGKVLTAIVAGGGANIIHDLTDTEPTITTDFQEEKEG